MLRNKETKTNFPHHPPSFQAQFPSFIPDFSTSSLPLLAQVGWRTRSGGQLLSDSPSASQFPCFSMGPSHKQHSFATCYSVKLPWAQAKPAQAWPPLHRSQFLSGACSSMVTSHGLQFPSEHNHLLRYGVLHGLLKCGYLL